MWVPTIRSLWPKVNGIHGDELLASDTVLGASFDAMSKAQLKWIFEHVLGVDEPSDEYVSLRRKVNHSLSECHEAITAAARAITRVSTILQIETDADRMQLRARLLERLLPIAIFQKSLLRLDHIEQNAQSNSFVGYSERACMQIAGVELEGASATNMTLEELQFLTRITQKGTPVTSLYSLNMPDDNRHATTNATHTLFPPGKPSDHQQFALYKNGG